MGSATSMAMTSPPASFTPCDTPAMSEAFSRVTRMVTEYEALGLLTTNLFLVAPITGREGPHEEPLSTLPTSDAQLEKGGRALCSWLDLRRTISSRGRGDSTPRAVSTALAPQTLGDPELVAIYTEKLSKHASRTGYWNESKLSR